jgi:hypothetical protein
MGLTDDRVAYRFGSVRWTGDVVSWKGGCSTMGDDVPATVSGERLTLDFGRVDRAHIGGA